MGWLLVLFSEEPRHVILRPYIVYGSSVFLLLSVFVFFVLFGWPGGPIGCIYEEPHDGCYCEAFNLQDVEEGNPGIRQPVNTWSSLFSLITSGIIAWRMSEDRKQLFQVNQPQQQEQQHEHEQPQPQQQTEVPDESELTIEDDDIPNNIDHTAADVGYTNVMRSDNLIADWYVLTAVWSGLGKMYFHGSLVRWATYVDGVSSNFFYAYLPWYTFRRIHQSPDNADALFWIMYFFTVITISALQIYFGSLLASHLLLMFYFLMELYIFATTGAFLGSTIQSTGTWFLSFGLFGVAAGFWWASQTGRVMCDPESPWQIHALVWHPMVCVVMVLLYFYWRGVEDPDCIGAEAEGGGGAGEVHVHTAVELEERKQRIHRIGYDDEDWQ